MILAIILVPPMGLALMGTAFAVWWLGVGIVVIFGGLIGNVIGANRTNKSLRKEKAEEAVRS
ncbi:MULTISPECIES: hypothetical protein [unclassified Mesorhizobium]|uniref:hypothetical protein n=1 Tax=unclassified Mesorhizobium TaxID=325217 RepID=UPI00112A9EBE|nr:MULTISPECIES: hypothetical protein [unclassified Mesorhizobium]TPK53800.1 hypothetical protein FJ550_09370 [Mesorhizobium sp. B2-5-2]TPL17191.1 hypothetical protein FJ946_28910 [Mesorhizobium sp. B2-4-7]TPL33398.1 hypothetical protein FJ961_28770 [Mesorhizobium sp. B2-4-5]TPM68066.1 hypothetical protein FJ968_30025 [Mesorhizobium sp. B2-1-6]TPN73648.1 hypothetical protein FJ985_25855 [Mesorhizobium sp. B1-1-2]